MLLRNFMNNIPNSESQLTGVKRNKCGIEGNYQDIELDQGVARDYFTYLKVQLDHEGKYVEIITARINVAHLRKRHRKINKGTLNSIVSCPDRYKKTKIHTRMCETVTKNALMDMKSTKTLLPTEMDLLRRSARNLKLKDYENEEIKNVAQRKNCNRRYLEKTSGLI